MRLSRYVTFKSRYTTRMKTEFLTEFHRKDRKRLILTLKFSDLTES